MQRRPTHHGLICTAIAAIALATGSARADVDPGLPPGFRSQIADLGDVKIHYVIGGTGAPLLLVHGWPESWYEFRKMLPVLAKHHTVIAADYRGAGDSSAPATGYDKKTMAADLHRLMVKLGYPRATVLGHDWGGSIAYAYAAQFRDGVDKLIMAEGGPFGPWMPSAEPIWFFHFLRIPGYAERLARGRERAFLEYFYRNDEFHVVRAFDDATVDRYVRTFAQPGRMEASFGLYRTIDQDIRDNAELARVPLEIPVLAVGAQAGAGDAIARFARATARHVTAVVMAQTGHFIPEERPDALIEIVEHFLANEAVPATWTP